jgi:hypothetical protein
MSFIIKELVKSRIRQLSVEELLGYASDYGFTITKSEATTILHYIQSSDLDLFSKEAIEEVYIKIEEVTDHQTALKAKRLFEEIIKNYGIEDYFY